MLLKFCFYYRENYRHHTNVSELRRILEPLLKKRLKQGEFKFWCEVRLGRLAWKTTKASENCGRICLNNICELFKKEFYTR